MSILDNPVAIICNALAEMQPYLMLEVDITDSKIDLSASVYLNGNQEETWDGLTVDEFQELYDLNKDHNYFRINFHHIDATSDDFSNEQVGAMLALLGIDTGTDPRPVVSITPSVMTIGYADMTQLIAEAIESNGGQCGIELDGARWIVQQPAS